MFINKNNSQLYATILKFYVGGDVYKLSLTVRSRQCGPRFVQWLTIRFFVARSTKSEINCIHPVI